MKSAGIESYFEKIILSDEVGVNKPHPDIFRYALNKTGSSKNTSLMIGDNYDADILGAMRSGLDQVYFNPLQKQISDEFPTYEYKHYLRSVIYCRKTDFVVISGFRRNKIGAS